MQAFMIAHSQHIVSIEGLNDAIRTYARMILPRYLVSFCRARYRENNSNNNKNNNKQKQTNKQKYQQQPKKKNLKLLIYFTSPGWLPNQAVLPNLA